MTIGLGLVGNDGLVLCADMQRTISGYVKTFDGKVNTSIYHDPQIVLSIAGAGTGDYIETARQSLLDGLPEELTRRGEPLHRNIPIILKERFLQFFDDHLGRWAYYPERDRPSVELLIAVTGKNLYPRLFHCDGTAFHETRQKAIGDGVLIADQLLLEYTLGNYEVAELAALAVYILRKVKNGVDGCGGPTHGVALRKGYDFALIDSVQELEEQFSAMDKQSNVGLIRSICESKVGLRWMSEHKKKQESIKNEES